jgi:hypothetical protein
MGLKNRGLAYACLVCCLGLWAAAASGAIPRTLNYQGRLTNSSTGAPLQGAHEMTFRIYELESGGTAVWTETEAAEVDSVGVVSLILGADTPIDLVFDHPMWLEVEVDGEVLLPRREITSVPYAFCADGAARALDADMLDGLSADAFADSGHAHDDRYYTKPELNSPGNINDAGNPVDWTELKNVPAGFADGTDEAGGVGDGHSLDAADGDPVDVVYVAADGNVGVGTTSPGKQLDIAGDLRLGYGHGMSFGDDDTRLYQSGVDLYAKAPDDIHLRPGGDLYVGDAGGDWAVFDNGKQRLGIGTTSPSQALDVVGNAVIAGYGGSPLKLSSTGYSFIEFDNPGPGPMGLRFENSHGAMFMAHGADGEDRFGIINTSPAKEVLSIDWETNSVGIWNTEPDTIAGVDLDASGRTVGLLATGARDFPILAEYTGNHPAAAVGARCYSDQGSAFEAYAYDGFAALAAHGAGGVQYVVYAEANGSDYAGYFDGIVRISDDGPLNNRVLDVQDVEYNTAYQTVNFEMVSAPTNGHDVLQMVAPTGSPDTFQFIECQRGTDVEFRIQGNGDVYAEGKFYPDGADVAEMVAVASGAWAVEPGDVMVIDRGSPRAVVKSTAARSRLVAGIYSTNPGFIGGERDWGKPAAAGDEESGAYTLLDMASEFDEVPMAVVGIVPCKVSAENGPIRPGDLLVTSATPGHAMRDDDPGVGTVLGKAMESLDSGTGLIRVLVTLQ